MLQSKGFSSECTSAPFAAVSCGSACDRQECEGHSYRDHRSPTLLLEPWSLQSSQDRGPGPCLCQSPGGSAVTLLATRLCAQHLPWMVAPVGQALG